MIDTDALQDAINKLKDQMNQTQDQPTDETESDEGVVVLQLDDDEAFGYIMARKAFASGVLLGVIAAENGTDVTPDLLDYTWGMFLKTELLDSLGLLD